MRKLLPFLLLFVLTTGCTRPCHSYRVVGAHDFVTDSYKIRQGKLAIQEMMGVDAGELPFDAMKEFPYTIADGDSLNIALYHPTRKDLVDVIEKINSNMDGFTVVDGYIKFPEIEPLQVGGLTLAEAHDVLQHKLQEEFQEAELFISFKNKKKGRVDFIGPVAQTSIPVDGKIRLFEVLSQSHIAAPFNLFMSYVMRDGEQLPIDLHRLMNQGDMSQNIVMRGGDKIFLAPLSDAVVMVMGEVFAPRAVSVPYGFITLPEAIVTAGGIPFTGDRCRIQIIRGDMRCPKIYVISWNHIINLPNHSMLLMPGDTVFVSEKPITQWNRFISQLLPSLDGARAVRHTYDMFK